MGLAEMVERLGSIEGLDAVGRPLQDSVDKLLPPGPLQDALRGRWLGHPLHPMLTDVPIGFWTSAVVLDLVGGRSAERSADLLVGLGLAASVPTAVAGIADWSQASRPARRQGIVHALANTTAQVLFMASLATRGGNRKAGKRLGLLGAVALAAGGYIGAHLSYVEGVGVSPRAATEPADPPTQGT